MLCRVPACRTAGSVALWEWVRIRLRVAEFTMPQVSGLVIAILALMLGLPNESGAAGRAAPAMLAIPAGVPARIDGSLKPGE